MNMKKIATILAMLCLISCESSKTSNFIDKRDGKKYKTVKIGEQTWMAENLNYNAEGSKCYEDNESNCKKYGRLYDRKTAQKACPEGWHLPSKNEWAALMTAAGGEKTAGRKLKATSGWNDSGGKPGNGEDTFGFSALPSGYFNSDGYFSNVGDIGTWWSASEDGIVMNYISDVAYWDYYGKSFLYSVRCLQGTNSNANLSQPELESEAKTNLSPSELEATQELESKAQKWQNNVKTNRNKIKTATTEGKYFSYKIKRREPSCTDCGDGGSVRWEAVSKIKIGNCPIGSTWEMGYDIYECTSWGNKVPAECNSITPKIITDYEGINDPAGLCS